MKAIKYNGQSLGFRARPLGLNSVSTSTLQQFILFILFLFKNFFIVISPIQFFFLLYSMVTQLHIHFLIWKMVQLDGKQKVQASQPLGCSCSWQLRRFLYRFSSFLKSGCKCKYFLLYTQNLVKLFQDMYYFQPIISMFKQSVELSSRIRVEQMKYYQLGSGTMLSTQKRKWYVSEALGLSIVTIQHKNINNHVPTTPEYLIYKTEGILFQIVIIFHFELTMISCSYVQTPQASSTQKMTSKLPKYCRRRENEHCQDRIKVKYGHERQAQYYQCCLFNRQETRGTYSRALSPRRRWGQFQQILRHLQTTVTAHLSGSPGQCSIY